MFNGVALGPCCFEVCIDLSSKQLCGGIVAAFVHLSWKAACFTLLSLNVSLPFCSVRLIKGLLCGSARAAQPCSEKTLLFLFVPWNPELESCFPASWWPEHCGNHLKDVLPYVPHGPITPLPQPQTCWSSRTYYKASTKGSTFVFLSKTWRNTSIHPRAKGKWGNFKKGI